MTPLRSFSHLLLIWVVCGGCAAQAPTAGLDRIPLKTGWMRSETTMRSWKALRDRNVVLQRFDYSCGAGALATLLRYYFNDDVNEEEILQSILSPMTADQILDREQNGFSLLDLKRCAEARGYQAVAAKLTYASLKQLRGPVLIHLNQENYKHFAVYKGAWGDRVYLADPSRGNIRLPIYRFAKAWHGVALILGKKGFGLPQDYPLALTPQDQGQIELQSARNALYMK